MGKDFEIVKLKGSENFHTWKFAIENLLMYKQLEKTIEASEDDPEEAIEKNAQKLAQAKCTINLSVEENLYVHISGANSALETMNILKKLYEDRGLGRRITLLRELISVRLDESESIQSYIESIKTTSNKLTGIGFSVDDEWLGAIMLAGLTDDFKPLIMGIEANTTKITTDLVTGKLLDLQSSTKSSGEAFFVKKGKKNNKWKNKKCYTCGSPSHISKNCDSKKNDNKDSKKGDQKKHKTESAFSALLCEEFDTEVSSDCESSDHKKNETFDTEVSSDYESSDNEEDEQIASCALLCAEKNDDWYVDSGASAHMTPNENLLTDVKEANVKDILSASKNQMPVKKYGNARLELEESDININNVLYVPDIAVNLLSVHKIVQHGNSVLFDENGCTIRNKRKEIIASCAEKNGVYKLKNKTETCFLSRQKASAITWHRRLGHMCVSTMKKMRDGAVDGIQFADDDSAIKSCETCARGKQSRIPFKISTSTTTKILELVHSDVMGKTETRSIGHAQYLLTIIDDYSRKVFVYFLRSKSQVLDMFIEFKAYVENHTGEKIKTIRSDNGGEYCSREFDKFCKVNGILHQTSTVETPQQNGVAERMNRTLTEKAKCFLFDAELPKTYWAEAINMAAYVVNRSTTKALKNGKTPLEMFDGKKPNLNDLIIFGSTAMVYQHKSHRKKFDANSRKMIFVGYDSATKGYRCIDPNTRKMVISRDVKIIEKGECSKVQYDSSDSSNSPSDHSADEGDFVTPKNGNATEKPNDVQNEKSGETVSTETETTESEGADQTITNANDTAVSPPDDVRNDPNFETRAETSGESTPRRGSRDRYQFRPFQINHFALFVEPTSVKQALECEQCDEWKKAMREEIQAHTSNGTWTLTELPKNRKVIKAKWVFKIKKSTINNTRYKGRLVAKGFSQTFGIDYTETYAPVVRNTTIRILLAVAVKRKMKICQMDAVSAFLQGDLDEEIYMSQPEGFEDGTNRVCKLNKAIYGLKQAGRQWNIKLDTALLSYGLLRSQNDPCVYYTIKREIIVAIYVDDFLIFYVHVDDLIKLKNFLNKAFNMKDMGEARHCLGLNIHQVENSIEIDQCGYIDEILDRFGMINSNSQVSPSDTNQKLSVSMVDDENTLVGKVPYQEAIGSLLYLAGLTRPDIAFAVNDLSRFNKNHSEPHWRAVKRVFRYLLGTKNLRLRYCGKCPLIAWSDADYASEIDERRSCSGYVLMLSGAAVSWLSKRQPIVAQSSTEAEYIALSETVKEVLWARKIISEIEGAPFTTPTIVFGDNTSAIKLAKNDAFSQRTKHIDVRYHHIRQQVKDGIIILKHAGTESMIADVLTKAVSGEKQRYCTENMGLK